MDRVTGSKQKVNVSLKDSLSTVLTFDAALEEIHQSESEITDYPVEEGADHTDHVRARPITFTMKGMVSDFPIVVDLSNNAPPNSTGQNTNSRVKDAYAFLESARVKGKLVNVFTRFRTYDNMLIQSISAPRNSSTGNAVVFDLSFRQVSFGVVARTTAPKPRNKSRSSRKKKGAKAVKAVKEAALTVTDTINEFTGAFGTKKPRTTLLGKIVG